MSVVLEEGWEFTFSCHIKFNFFCPACQTNLDLNLIFGLQSITLSSLLFYVQLYGVGGRGISQYGVRSEAVLCQVDLTSMTVCCWQPHGRFRSERSTLRRWNSVAEQSNSDKRYTVNLSESLPLILCVCKCIIYIHIIYIHTQCNTRTLMVKRITAM